MWQFAKSTEEFFSVDTSGGKHRQGRGLRGEVDGGARIMISRPRKRGKDTGVHTDNDDIRGALMCSSGHLRTVIGHSCPID